MDGSDDVPGDSSGRISTHSKMPRKRLDPDGVLLEKLHRLKNERSGYLSTASARRNEMDVLLSNEENISLVKEKLPSFLAAFEAFKEVHLAYSSNLQDEASFTRCQEQFNFETVRADESGLGDQRRF